MESWLDISIEILSCLLTLRRVRSSGNAKDDLESLCNYRPLRFPDNFTEEGKKGQMVRDVIFIEKFFSPPRAETIYHFVISWKNFKSRDFVSSIYSNLTIVQYAHQRFYFLRFVAVHCNCLPFNEFIFNDKVKLGLIKRIELLSTAIDVEETIIIKQEEEEHLHTQL